MSDVQVLSLTPAPLREPNPIGPIATARCEGRCCSSRTAPVFCVLGTKGVSYLCATCRDWRVRTLHAALPAMKGSH